MINVDKYEEHKHNDIPSIDFNKQFLVLISESIFLCTYFVSWNCSAYLDAFASVEPCFKMHTLYIRGVRFSSCPSLGTSALITSREWHTGKGASGDSLVAMTT